MSSYRVIALDEIEAIPGPDTLTWRPVRATLGLKAFDAPAGTYVHLPDPKVHRHAVALEPGTTVLSFGGPPTFQPSEWEERFFAAGRSRQNEDEE